MFHVANGLYFERGLQNGAVRVLKTYDGREPRPDNVVLDQTMSVTAFASVVAAMSRRGGTADTFHEVCDLLTKP